MASRANLTTGLGRSCVGPIRIMRPGGRVRPTLCGTWSQKGGPAGKRRVGGFVQDGLSLHWRPPIGGGHGTNEGEEAVCAD